MNKLCSFLCYSFAVFCPCWREPSSFSLSFTHTHTSVASYHPLLIFQSHTHSLSSSRIPSHSSSHTYAHTLWLLVIVCCQFFSMARQQQQQQQQQQQHRLNDLFVSLPLLHGDVICEKNDNYFESRRTHSFWLIQKLFRNKNSKRNTPSLFPTILWWNFAPRVDSLHCY